MNFDAAVSFLLKSQPPGTDPDVAGIASKLGKPPQSVHMALDRIEKAKAKARAAQAKAKRQTRQARAVRDAIAKAQPASAVPKIDRKAFFDAALLAAAAKYAEGAEIITADLARAIGRHPASVATSIKRLRAAGQWPWSAGDGRIVVREFHKWRPRPPARVVSYRSKVAVPKVPVDLSTCVMLHGPDRKPKPIDKAEARAAVDEMLAAWRSRSKAEIHRAVYRGSRA